MTHRVTHLCFRAPSSLQFQVYARPNVNPLYRPVNVLCSLADDAASKAPTRRAFMRCASTAFAAAASAAVLPHTLAPALASLRENVADIASLVPGSGSPDVHYPDYAEGDWDVSRTLYAVADGPGADPDDLARIRKHIGPCDKCKRRFVEHRGHIVADRGFNEKQELQASQGKGAVVRTQFAFDNPNVMTVSMMQREAPSLTREVKITKRAYEDKPEGFGTFSTSEYARIVDVGGERGVQMLGIGGTPRIYGRRRVSLVHVVSPRDFATLPHIYLDV
jgi:hypothetical protein